jgi:ABC-type amino acid transport substrate-binding protein
MSLASNTLVISLGFLAWTKSFSTPVVSSSASPAPRAAVKILTMPDVKPPGQKVPSGGVIITIATEIVKKTVQHMKYEPKIEFLPWKRALELATNAEYAGIFPGRKSAKAERDFLFSRPLYSYGLKAVVPKSSPHMKLDRKALKGMSTCDGLGSTVLDGYEIDIIRVSTSIQCFRLLSSRRVDFILIPENRFDELDPSIEYRVIPDNLNIVIAGRFLINKNYPKAEKFMEEFNKAHASLEKAGVWDKLALGYGYRNLQAAEVSE